jgi:ribosomal protein L37AE/L43A
MSKGQRVTGCTVGGNVVQEGSGPQAVTGSTVAGSIIQAGATPETKPCEGCGEPMVRVRQITGHVWHCTGCGQGGGPA